MTDADRPRSFTLPDTADTAEALGVLTSLLWRERETLERLLFKLIEQQLVLSTGSARWLPAADAEVREAAEALQNYELARSAEVDLLVQQYGLPADTSLRELADAAPEPWPLVLHEHRDELRSLTTEIDAATAENRRLMRAGEAATREALDRLGRPGQGSAPRTRGYTATGEATRDLPGAAFFLDQRA